MTESSVSVVGVGVQRSAVAFEAGPSAVCTSDGAELVLVGWGSCEVTATQAGDRRYEPAVPVTRWIAVLSGVLMRRVRRCRTWWSTRGP